MDPFMAVLNLLQEFEQPRALGPDIVVMLADDVPRQLGERRSDPLLGLCLACGFFQIVQKLEHGFR
jgi:hypothetical protein